MEVLVFKQTCLIYYCQESLKCAGYPVVLPQEPLLTFGSAASFGGSTAPLGLSKALLRRGIKGSSRRSRFPREQHLAVAAPVLETQTAGSLRTIRCAPWGVSAARLQNDERPVPSEVFSLG